MTAPPSDRPLPPADSFKLLENDFVHGPLTATRIAAGAFGLMSGLFMGNIFPAAFEVVPTSSRASAVGVLNLCGGMVSGFAMLFGGLWKQSLGIDRLMGFTACGFVVAGLLLLAGLGRLFDTDRAKVQK